MVSFSYLFLHLSVFAVVLFLSALHSKSSVYHSSSSLCLYSLLIISSLSYSDVFISSFLSLRRSLLFPYNLFLSMECTHQSSFLLQQPHPASTQSSVWRNCPFLQHHSSMPASANLWPSFNACAISPPTLPMLG